MSFSDVWKDLENGKSDINAGDLNLIAQYTIENETALNGKVDKEEGKGLSSNDFIDEYKEKLEDIKNADYNQNDSTKVDYIKNRPFYENYYCICDYNEKTEHGRVNPTVQMNEGITLVKGEHLFFEIVEDGKVTFDEIERLGVDMGDYDNLIFKSGRFYSWEEGSNTITVQTWEEAYEISVKITRPGEIKQIDEKFIPDSIKYTYEPSKIGEAPADTDIETVFINCTEEIEEGDTIMVRGYFSDDVEEYIITVPNELNPDYANQIAESLGRIGNVYLPIPTTVTFSCEIKGEVYKLNKKPISEATTELYGIVKEMDEALDRVIEKYGLGGFVMPEGAFALTPHIPIEKGKYQFVCFIKDDGTILTEIPEHYVINGGIGTDIETDVSSAGLSYDYPYLEISNNTEILGGFDYLSGDYTVNFETIKGTTYVVKVG